jgi:hypothetical protein
MKIHIMVFWIVNPRAVVVGYQPFGGPCCLQFYLDHDPNFQKYTFLKYPFRLLACADMNESILYQLPSA